MAVDDQPPSRRRRQLDLGSGMAGGTRDEPPAAGEGAVASCASSRRTRLQQSQLPLAQVETEERKPGADGPRARRRAEAIRAAEAGASAETVDAGLTPIGETRRDRRRRQAEGAVESAVGTASGVVRAALDRISPRRRPAEETELLALVPDRDDVVSQRGGALEGDGAEHAQPANHGGGVTQRAIAATWVEDAATGTFHRAADARRAEPSAKRRLLETLGLTRSAEPIGTERMAVLAARARAVLSAALMVSEGFLAGISLLHILVVERCAQREFLVVGYLLAARTTQQTFHVLCTMAVLSSLVALGSASAQLERLEKGAQRWEALKLHRDASYQQASAAIVATLYAVALICSLLTVRARAPLARPLPSPHRAGRDVDLERRPAPPRRARARALLNSGSLDIRTRRRISFCGAHAPHPSGARARRATDDQAETVWRWSLIDPLSVAQLPKAELDRFSEGVFDNAYPLWRGLSRARAHTVRQCGARHPARPSRAPLVTSNGGSCRAAPRRAISPRSHANSGVPARVGHCDCLLLAPRDCAGCRQSARGTAVAHRHACLCNRAVILRVARK